MKVIQHISKKIMAREQLVNISARWKAEGNGPAARLGAVGDIVIVISYARMDFEIAKNFRPSIIFPGSENRLF